MSEELTTAGLQFDSHHFIFRVLFLDALCVQWATRQASSAGRE